MHAHHPVIARKSPVKLVYTPTPTPNPNPKFQVEVQDTCIFLSFVLPGQAFYTWGNKMDETPIRVPF